LLKPKKFVSFDAIFKNIKCGLKNSEKFETNSLSLIVIRIFMSSIEIYGAPKVIAPSNPIQIIVKKTVGILSRNLKMLIF
jgi:hypothetical protein